MTVAAQQEQGGRQMEPELGTGAGTGALQFRSGSLRSWDRLGLDSPFSRQGSVGHDFFRADGSVDSTGNTHMAHALNLNVGLPTSGSMHMKSREGGSRLGDDPPPLFDSWLHEMVAEDPELLCAEHNAMGSGDLSMSKLFTPRGAGVPDSAGPVDVDSVRFEMLRVETGHQQPYRHQTTPVRPSWAPSGQQLPRSRSGKALVGVRPSEAGEASAFPFTPQQPDLATRQASSRAQMYTYEHSSPQKQHAPQTQSSPPRQAVPRHPLLAPVAGLNAAPSYAPVGGAYYAQVNAPAVILPSGNDPSQPAFQYTYDTAWAAPAIVSYSGDRSRDGRAVGPPQFEHLGSRATSSSKDMLFADDRSTTTGGRTAPTVSSYDSYESATTGTGGSTKSIRKRKYKRSAASKFCHICLRKESAVQLVVCGNILTSTCLKVICEICFKTFGWDWAEATAEDSNWTCTHCRGVCPDKSRCKVYQKKNKDSRADVGRSSSSASLGVGRRSVSSGAGGSGGGSSVFKRISELPILQSLQK